MRRPSRTIHLALAVCFFMLASGLPVQAEDMGINEGLEVPTVQVDDEIMTRIPYDHQLRFNDLEFDPAVGILLPPNLRQCSDLFIVQFDGPIITSWKDDIRSLSSDVEFYWYLPNFAFIVKLPGHTVESVKAHGNVRAVYPYYTAFKVPRDMWEEQLSGRIADFVAVPLSDEAVIASDIEAMGGRVYGYSTGEVLFSVVEYRFLDVAALENVGWVQRFSEPTMMNDNYGRTIKVRQQSNGAFTDDGRSLWSFDSGNFPGDSAGEGQIVAVYDTGMDTTHPAFLDTPGDDSKLVWFKDYTDGSENDWHDTGSHGTHTSCTVLGNGKWRASDPGTEGTYSGMAPRARLIGQAGLSVGAGTVYTHLNEPLAHGANHTSNSWGDPASHKRYTSLSMNYDLYTRDANSTQAGDQEILSVFAAGNEGATGPREPAVAKNVLTVGATGNDKGSSSSSVVGFSAKGPTDDGRTKPDVVTPGDGVVSCSTGTTSYRSASGTSMACPGAAGGVAVVRSYWNNTHGYTPSPALTKAIVVNGATPIPGYGYPGQSQGWGRMNVARSVLENATWNIEVLEQDPGLALETGFSVRVPIEVNSASPIRVTLAWTDVPGASDNPKPALVNDLNLKMITPTEQFYWGNAFSTGSSITGGSADNINNVEGFYLPIPAVGSWSLRVEGFNIADGPQDFALVVAGDLDMGMPVLEAEDLIPTNLTFEPSEGLLEGDLMTIKADINNNGTRTTSVVRYQWYIDNMLAAILTYDGEVLPKGKASIDYSWRATRGDHEIRLVLDPFNTHFEQNESNNWIMDKVHVDHYGLELNIKEKNSKKADPGGDATYILQVKNQGSLTDNYTLEHDPPPDKWSASLGTDLLEVPAGETREVSFTVGTPPKALTTEFARLSVRVRSLGNLTYEDDIVTVTSINQIAALDMSIGVNESTIAPKGKAKFEFMIFNEGNGQDTVTMTVNGTSWGWFVGLSEYTVVLDPYSSKDLNCVVTAPFNAIAGTKVPARIEGFATSGVFAYVDIMTTVEKVSGMNLSSMAGPEDLYPGETVQFPFTLKNEGNDGEDMTLTADVPDGWETNITTEVVTMGPFEQVVRMLTLTVPEGEVMGTRMITLTADNGTDTIELDFEVTIKHVYGLSASMSPEYQNATKGQEVVFNITILNEGNGPDTFELWLDSQKLINSRFSNGTVSLGPGVSAEIFLTVNTSYLGADNYSVPIHVYSTLSQSANEDLEAMLEVLEPPPEKPQKPEKPEKPPGPIDITPGGDMTSMSGLLLILFLIFLIILIGGVMAATYSRYRRLKDERSAMEGGDRIRDDLKEGPEEPEELVSSYEEPRSTFDLDAHLTGFTTSKGTGPVEETPPTDDLLADETSTPAEGSVEMVDAASDTAPEGPDEDEGFALPLQVVDDTVSSTLFGGSAATEDETSYEEQGPRPIDERADEAVADQEGTPPADEVVEEKETDEKKEEKSRSEKEMEDRERSLDDIMKDLDI